jgi:hypothetical protein
MDSTTSRSMIVDLSENKSVQNIAYLIENTSTNTSRNEAYTNPTWFPMYGMSNIAMPKSDLQKFENAEKKLASYCESSCPSEMELDLTSFFKLLISMVSLIWLLFYYPVMSKLPQPNDDIIR